MAAVINSKGKFILQPEPARSARGNSTQDRETLAKEIGMVELCSLLNRVLLRLEQLEKE